MANLSIRLIKTLAYSAITLCWIGLKETRGEVISPHEMMRMSPSKYVTILDFSNIPKVNLVISHVSTKIRGEFDFRPCFTVPPACQRLCGTAFFKDNFLWEIESEHCMDRILGRRFVPEQSKSRQRLKDSSGVSVIFNPPRDTDGIMGWHGIIRPEQIKGSEKIGWSPLEDWHNLGTFKRLKISQLMDHRRCLSAHQGSLLSHDASLLTGNIGLTTHDSALPLVGLVLKENEISLKATYNHQESIKDGLSDSSPSLPRLFGWFGLCLGLIGMGPLFWNWGEYLRDRHNERNANCLGYIGLGCMWLGLILWGLGTWPIMLSWRLFW